MANYFAVANGNFSDSNTWSSTPAGAGGAGVPTVGDNAYANNRTVVLDLSVTCNKITNRNENGATNGGSFTPTNGITVTANIEGGTISTPVITLSSTLSMNIVGNISHVSSANMGVITCNGSGTLNITGSIFAGGGNSADGVRSNSGHSGTLNIVGDITGGLAIFAVGLKVLNGSTAIINITGNIYAGTGTPNALGVSIANSVSCNCTIIGNIYANILNSGLVSSGNSTTVNFSGSTFNATNGLTAFQARKLFNQIIPQTAVRQIAVDGSSTMVTYYTVDNDVFDYAQIFDVRDGVSYADGNLVGTCKIPSPNNVTYNTPTDNTVGTAVLKPENIWDYLKNNIDTEGSIGERLKNAVTVNDMGKLLIDTLT